MSRKSGLEGRSVLVPPNGWSHRHSRQSVRPSRPPLGQRQGLSLRFVAVSRKIGHKLQGKRQSDRVRGRRPIPSARFRRSTGQEGSRIQDALHPVSTMKRGGGKLPPPCAAFVPIRDFSRIPSEAAPISPLHSYTGPREALRSGRENRAP